MTDGNQPGTAKLQYVSPRGIDVKRFHASGSAAQTSGSMASGSQILTGIDASSFKPGQGVFVENGGLEGSGNDLIPTVQTILSPTSLQLSAPSVRAVNDLLVQHDDQIAMRNAFLYGYLNGGKTSDVYIPNGEYRMNKAFDTNANALLSLPYFPRTGSSATFTATGQQVTRDIWQLQKATEGVIFSTDLIGADVQIGGLTVKPSFFAARRTSDTSSETFAEEFNTMDVELSRIHFIVPDNPRITAINNSNAMNMILNQIVGSPKSRPYLTAEPTNDSMGVFAPQVNNNTTVRMTDCYFYGFKVGAKLNEHAVLDSCLFYRCLKAIQSGKGYRAISGNVRIEQCETYIEFLGQSSVFLTIYGELGASNPPTWFSSKPYKDFIDANNVADGMVHFEVTEQNIGDTLTYKPSVTGCGGVEFINLASRRKEVNSITVRNDDDFTAQSSVVSRLLPAPPTPLPGRTMADFFETEGNLHGRKPDTLGDGVWSVTPEGAAGGVIVVGDNIAKHIGGTPIGLYRPATGGKASNRVDFNRGYVEGGIIIPHALNSDNWLGVFWDGAKVEYYRRTAGGAIQAMQPQTVTTADGHLIAAEYNDLTQVLTAYLLNATRTFSGVAPFAGAIEYGYRASGYSEILDIQGI